MSGTAGRLRPPALPGRIWPVSWEEAEPLVTAVVRCDPVVCGPDVAPAVKSLEGYPPPMAFQRWASGGSAVSSPMRAWILRLAAAAAPRISVRTMIQIKGGFFLPPSLPAWSSTTTVAGPLGSPVTLACHIRHAVVNAAAAPERWRWSWPDHDCPPGTAVVPWCVPWFMPQPCPRCR